MKKCSWNKKKVFCLQEGERVRRWWQLLWHVIDSMGVKGATALTNTNYTVRGTSLVLCVKYRFVVGLGQSFDFRPCSLFLMNSKFRKQQEKMVKELLLQNNAAFRCRVQTELLWSHRLTSRCSSGWIASERCHYQEQGSVFTSCLPLTL